MIEAMFMIDDGEGQSIGEGLSWGSNVRMLCFLFWLQ